MAGLCVLNSERTPRKWLYPPIIYQADKSNNNLLNSLRNDKQISEVFSPLILDLLLAERQADKDDNKPS